MPHLSDLSALLTALLGKWWIIITGLGGVILTLYSGWKGRLTLKVIGQVLGLLCLLVALVGVWYDEHQALEQTRTDFGEAQRRLRTMEAENARLKGQAANLEKQLKDRLGAPSRPVPPVPEAPRVERDANAPKRSYPRDGASMQQPYSGPWVFKWDEPERFAGIVEYQLLVIREQSDKPFIDVTTKEPTYTAPRKCEYVPDIWRKDWIWKVRAKDKWGQWTPWSEERRFSLYHYEPKTDVQYFCLSCPGHWDCRTRGN